MLTSRTIVKRSALFTKVVRRLVHQKRGYYYAPLRALESRCRRLDIPISVRSYYQDSQHVLESYRVSVKLFVLRERLIVFRN